MDRQCRFGASTDRDPGDDYHHHPDHRQAVEGAIQTQNLMYQFGTTSQRRLATCHQDMRLIMSVAIQRSQVDFGIAEGHRSIARQQQLFKEKKSRVDGINKLGKHNYNPSLAADVYAWVNGKANWDEKHLAYIGGVVTAVAKELLAQGRISHDIRWGANWDRDGEIITDQDFDDLPHFELVKPE